MRVNREEEFDLDLTGATGGFDEAAPHTVGAGPDAAYGTSPRGARTDERAGDEAPALQPRADAAPTSGARADARRRGPGPWLALGATLILTGVLAAPAPPGEQIGIIDSALEPQVQWQVDIGFELEADFAGLPDRPSLMLAENALIYLVSSQILAVDLDDGSELWSMDGANLQCHLTDPIILCSSGEGIDTELVRLHTTDGEIGRTVRPGLLAALAVNDDIVTLSGEGDNTVVSRDDPQGRLLWSHRLPDQRAWTDDDPLATWLHVAGDRVFVGILGELAGQGAILTAETGAAEEIEALEDLVLIYRDVGLSPSPWVASTADGRLHLIHTDGELGEPLPPGAPMMRVDDDPDSELVFTITNSGLTAHSRGDGPVVWRWEEAHQLFALSRLGETLIVGTAEGTFGLDQQSGSQRWHRTTTSSVPLYGDGETLVQVKYDNDTPRLVGIDSRTGTETFLFPFNGFTPFATAVAEGQLALLGENGLTLLTW